MFENILNFSQRLGQILPTGWFSGEAPILSGILEGFGAGIAAIYALIQQIQTQARIVTSTGPFLDFAAADFFSNSFARWSGESDNSFRVRVLKELLRARGTRASLIRAISDLTGMEPAVFEPCSPLDTGGYSVGGVGYCVAGGWGNLELPFQSFVTAHVPIGFGISEVAGYGTGGYLEYVNLSMVETGPTVSDIQYCVAAQAPLGYLIWIRVNN